MQSAHEQNKELQVTLSDSSVCGHCTPWPESASELYRPSDHRLSAKLLPTFADSECHVGSLRPYSRFSRPDSMWPLLKKIRGNLRLSAKLVPTFAVRGCHVVGVTDPYGRILDFLDRSSYFFVQVDPLLLGKSGPLDL
jgi:hypothetical protein